MAYQAIYRKWRPTTFEDVVGQSHITDTLKTEIKTDRLAHAYLFCGTRGTGKTTTAKILSRAVNCETPLADGNPCNQCPSCKGILANSVMDVVEIDAASNNGVDNIRDLRDEISYTPANVKYKIYIIDEVHMLSPGAFNALLKTLEEPPAHAIFILATTEPHKIPATIQSRCQRFDFRRISAKNIAGRIGEITRKDGINITPDAIRLVAQLGDGSMRDALSILDLCSGIEGEITRTDIENVTGAVSRTALVDMSVALINGDISKAISLIGTMLDAGRETGTLLDELIMCFREILVCKITDNPESIMDKSPEDIETYKQIGTNVPKETLLHIIKVLSETASLCKTSTNPRVMIEASAVKICDPSSDPSTEAFASRLAKLEAMITMGTPVAVATPVVAVPETVAEPVTQVVEATEADEEYVCETEEYEEDDVPPFDIPFDVPPFEVAPPVQEVAEQTVEPISQEPVVQPIVPENTARLDINKVISIINDKNPAFASLLTEATLQEKEGTHFVVFTSDIFKNMATANPDLTASIKDALQSDRVKLVTEDEFNNTSKMSDPFEEIISKADGIEQISIF